MFYTLNADKTFNPCSIEEWSNQFATIDRIVSYTELNDYIISTVWLGYDSRVFPDKNHLFLFETIIVNSENESVYFMKYRKWNDAKKGHANAVQLIQQCQFLIPSLLEYDNLENYDTGNLDV